MKIQFDDEPQFSPFTVTLKFDSQNDIDNFLAPFKHTMYFVEYDDITDYGTYGYAINQIAQYLKFRGEKQ